MDSFASTTAKTILVLLLATAFIVSTNAVEKGYYRAAVVDYHVLTNYNLTPRQNFMANVHNYEQFIDIANQESADIIVFPEGALLGRDFSIYLTVPDPAQNVIPFNSQIYDESIQKLSLYAKNYSIYLAVNLHENYTDPNSMKTFKYNTNIVFNREGAIVARYRKFNLYGEALDVTDKPEYSYFDSDFGVRFGLFNCFDILFKEPTLTLINKYNVTDFVYSSKWFSELPFLTSVQRQWSWAVGNDVNLLSAGLNNVTRGNAGSGIFRGKNAPNNLYTYSTKTGTTILVGDVPIRGKTVEGSGKPDIKLMESHTGEDKYPMLQQNEVNQFANEDIILPADRTSVVFKKELCHNELCCIFDLSLFYDNPTSSLQYKIVAYDGNIKFGIDPRVNMMQACGVVLCLNHSISSCGSAGVNGFLPNSNITITNVTFTSIKISGNFLKEDSNILPNILLWPNSIASPGEFLINTSELNFNNTNKNTTLILTPHSFRQIITVAIHSRVFSRDQGSRAYTLNVSILAVLLPLLVPVVVSYLSSSNL